ncbi:MAG: hypothetical protein ACI308_10530 [Muribaculaceae bacterium]
MNNNVKHLIMLAAGIAIAILLLAMPTSIYEGIKYFDGGYSNELYNHGLYSTFAIITVTVAWVMAIIYYYVINSVKMDRWPHWLIMLILNVVISTALCVIANTRMLMANSLSYGNESLQMALIHVALALVMFVVASFAIKGWSSNCRHSPC